jgi:hypothetical protein
MNSVKSITSEYEHVCNQLARVRNDTAALQERKKKLEEELKQYLEASNERGIVFGNTEFSLEKREKKERLKKSDEKRILMEVLRERGVAEPEQVLKEMDERGAHKTETSILKIKRHNLK